MIEADLKVGNLIRHNGCTKIIIAVYRDKVAVVKINPCTTNVNVEFGKCNVEFINREEDE